MKRKDTFKFSPSSLKAFKKAECKEQWRGLYRDKDFQLDPLEVMELGNYFEHLVLGELSTHDGNFSLKKSVEVDRIEEQAKRIREYIDKFYTIESVQYDAEREDRHGILDIILIRKDNKKKAVCDLKLTGDLDNDFGDYQWKDLSKVNVSQLVFYSTIYDADEYFYLIADYSPRMGKKRIDVEISNEAKTFVDNEVEDALIELEVLNRNGFPRVPVMSACSKCKLDCPVRIKDGDIIHEKISI